MHSFTSARLPFHIFNRFYYVLLPFDFLSLTLLTTIEIINNKGVDEKRCK